MMGKPLVIGIGCSEDAAEHVKSKQTLLKMPCGVSLLTSNIKVMFAFSVLHHNNTLVSLGSNKRCVHFLPHKTLGTYFKFCIVYIYVGLQKIRFWLQEVLKRQIMRLRPIIIFGVGTIFYVERRTKKKKKYPKYLQSAETLVLIKCTWGNLVPLTQFTETINKSNKLRSTQI